MVEAMAESVVQQDGLTEYVKKIIAKWLEIQRNVQEEPCIKPSQTLGQ